MALLCVLVPVLSTCKSDDSAIRAETARACVEHFDPDSNGQLVTIPPVLQNGDEAKRVVAEAYPTGLVPAGTSGIVSVAMLVDTAGYVARTRVAATSGYAALDSAATRAAVSFRFSPPYEGSTPACHWLTMPIPISPDT